MILAHDLNGIIHSHAVEALGLVLFAAIVFVVVCYSAWRRKR